MKKYALSVAVEDQEAQSPQEAVEQAVKAIENGFYNIQVVDEEEVDNK